jgi:hypothetical protein
MNENMEAQEAITTQMKRQLQVQEIQILQLEKVNKQWNALVEVRKEIRSLTPNDPSIERVMCFYSAKWDRRTGVVMLERLTSDEHINSLAIRHE